MSTRLQLRAELRARRNELTASQQAQAAQSLMTRLLSMPLVLTSQSIALYIAMDGEIALKPLIEQLWKMGKDCYLPAIHPKQEKQLLFVKYLPGSRLKPNRFNIPEVDEHKAEQVPAQLLDLVLVPLVGFDASGARLGMGGGFYDSTFSFKQQKTLNKPHLLGVAHACQQRDAIESESWDIPLDGIVTDKEIFLVSAQ
jgi:5-formyltetrahydrofolate cyclo-ligase